MFEEAVKVWENLKKQKLDCSLINARFIKPVDEEMIEELSREHSLIVTIEENVKTGGFGEHVLEYVHRKHLPVNVLILALGNVGVLRMENGIDSEGMTEKILEELKEL